jgi:hypothetical protein
MSSALMRKSTIEKLSVICQSFQIQQTADTPYLSRTIAEYRESRYLEKNAHLIFGIGD